MIGQMIDFIYMDSTFFADRAPDRQKGRDIDHHFKSIAKFFNGI